MAKINPQDVLRSADAFSGACIALDKAGKEGRALVMTMVMATLEALMVELYLKCLIMVEGGQYRRGHDLYALFKFLNPQTRDELKEAHDKYLTRWPAFVAQVRARGHSTDLESLLIRGRHSFMDFRYAHEAGGKKGIYFGLHGLSVCARERIMKLKPEWEASTWGHLIPNLGRSTSRTHQTGELDD